MAARPRRLEDRNCLIVGATSGIGLAAARRFLEEGARVVVAGLDDPAPGPLTCHVLETLRPLGPCAGWSMDASREADVAFLFEHALDFFAGRLDVLLHVAGISGRRYGDGPLDACTRGGWDRVMEVNAVSVLHTNQAAIRIMLGQERDGAGLRGSITNVGSVLARRPSPDLFGTYAYVASKGAIDAMTRSAAARYARDGVRFNLLAPGLIDSPMAARAVGDSRIREYLRTKQPLSGGPGTPEDCAEAALFLCEPASRLITGAILNVDGGWSLAEGQIPAEEPHE